MPYCPVCQREYQTNCGSCTVCSTKFYIPPEEFAADGRHSPRALALRRRRLLLYLILVLAALNLTRESGWLNLNYYSVSQEGSLLPTLAADTGETAPTESTATTNAGLATLVQRQMQASGRSDEGSTIHFSRLELSGYYFFPLFKSATCKVEVTRTDAADPQGSVSGKIHMRVIGFCSIREFRKAVARSVAAELASGAESP